MEKQDQQDQFTITASRVVYAAGALVITLGAADIIGLEPAGAKEVGLLNAAVAFYSHEAASRIVVGVRDAIRSARSPKGS